MRVVVIRTEDLTEECRGGCPAFRELFDQSVTYATELWRLMLGLDFDGEPLRLAEFDPTSGFDNAALAAVCEHAEVCEIVLDYHPHGISLQAEWRSERGDLKGHLNLIRSERGVESIATCLPLRPT